MTVIDIHDKQSLRALSSMDWNCRSATLGWRVPRGVGDAAFFAKRLVDLTHGGLVEPPHLFHDGELLRSQGRVGGAHLSTNYLVLSASCQEGGRSSPESL